jgi:hypothetical protein
MVSFCCQVGQWDGEFLTKSPEASCNGGLESTDFFFPKSFVDELQFQSRVRFLVEPQSTCSVDLLLGLSSLVAYHFIISCLTTLRAVPTPLMGW